tara:strand:- start:518 stop:1558 length:1041 start_codon:yes stop_codon:yes gene_type:complete
MKREISDNKNFIYDYLRELDIENFKLRKISNGANSQIYKIWKDKKKFILKIYPNREFLSRDRIGSECDFLNLLNKCGYKNVPKPIKWNYEKKWMLMSFLDGEYIKNIEIVHYKKLLKFIIELQKLKENKFSNNIKNASEASFKIIDHYEGIKKRLQIYSDKIFYLNYLSSLCKKQLKSLLETLNLEMDLIYKNQLSKFSQRQLNAEVNYHQKVLSQSDIGFHNIFKDKNNNLLFFDFEYAGWDDSFKLISDLVLQPDYGIKSNDFYLLDEILKYFFFNQNEYKRLYITFLMYKIKWTCIILNPLFNRVNETLDNQKSYQIIQKSQEYFTLINNKQKIFKLFLKSYY